MRTPILCVASAALLVVASAGQSRTTLSSSGLPKAVAAGAFHTCAITSAGGVECWGDNGDGQLGDGTNIDRVTPVPVVGLNHGVSAIAAGGRGTCALTRKGAVKCWGEIGSFAYQSDTPVTVPGLAGGVTAIAAGRGGEYDDFEDEFVGSHACALTSAGAVKCWGLNQYGQLGDGTTTDRHRPVTVQGLASGVQAIAAGEKHSCALTTAGAVKCWGDDRSGQLGDGRGCGGDDCGLFSSTPVDVVGLSGGVKSIAAGGDQSCALLFDGSVKCWGAIGGSTPLDAHLPSPAKAIAVGAFHVCAIESGGGVTCWGGDGRSGELGDGTTRYGGPVQVSGLTTGVVSIAAGGLHTCAITSTRTIKCWGSRQSGELGDGKTDHSPTPGDVFGLTERVAGLDRNCILTAGGGVKCWGNQVFPLAYGIPIGISGLAGGIKEISPPCAVMTAGAVKCWSDGYLTSVPGLSSGVETVAANEDHACALTNEGGVKCWGDDWAGQLGDGGTCGVSCPDPVAVSGLSGDVTAITVGGYHSCALTSGGAVKCWGDGEQGQLGDGATEIRKTPVAVSGLSSGVVSIAAGDQDTCALMSSGAAKCWGLNSNGQLGRATNDTCYVNVTQPANCSLKPLGVPGLASGVTQISASFADTCALLSSGRMKCWGWNLHGQVGDGTTEDRFSPVWVRGLGGRAVSISLDDYNTCAAMEVGGVKCWGWNQRGELGDGAGWLPEGVVGFGRECVVPDVKGRRLVPAKHAIRKGKCTIGSVRRAFSRTVRARRVMAQKPRPGVHKRAGAKVYLVVSKGERRQA